MAFNSSSVKMVAMAAVLLAAMASLPTQVQADCSDRTLSCVLGANVAYNSEQMTGVKIGPECTVALEGPSCSVSGEVSSSSGSTFMAEGTAAGSLTQGRCFELFSGCLPNNCEGDDQKPEDLCNDKYPECAGTCTVTCSDACSNT